MFGRNDGPILFRQLSVLEEQQLQVWEVHRFNWIQWIQWIQWILINPNARAAPIGYYFEPGCTIVYLD